MSWYNPLSWGKSADQPVQRQAEGTVTKAVVPIKGMTGPQARLSQDPFSTEILRFPPNIGSGGGVGSSVPKMLHWIKFTPCVQNKSEYNVKVDNVMSIADSNRAGNGYGAGSVNPFSGTESAGLAAGLGALNSIGVAGETLQGVLGAKNAREAESAALKGLGQEAGVLAGAAVSGGIVASIDLSRKTRRASAYICLYMPDTINQQLVNDYDQVSLTQALGKAGLVGAAGGAIADTLKGVVSGQNMIQGTGQGGGGVGGAGSAAEVAGLVAEKTGNFGAGIGDVLLFSAGVAQNPQVELLFKSIQNREFMFDFKFVPKNAAEAKTIRDIIQKFRFHAAPEIPATGKGRYFIPPSEFDIEFMIGDTWNTNLPKLSTCVLQGIDVNYGSAGQWTAFQDGMPIEISMQLRFKEVEILHKGLIAKGY
jgi:hypothetical protein